MNRISKSAVLLALVLTAATVLGETPADKGARIMREQDQAPLFEKVRATLKLVIHDGAGALKYSKEIIMATYTENMGMANQVEKFLGTFIAPAEDRNNAILNINPRGKASEKYFYLKDIRKTKKVTGADKSLPFFGSEFSNGDMGRPDFVEWNYKWLRDDKIEFRGKQFECAVIECYPKNDQVRNDLGYGKKIHFVERKTRLTMLIEYYDRAGAKVKELRMLAFMVKNNSRGERVYYTTALEMKSVKTGAKTKLLFTDLLFEVDATVSPDVFDVPSLTRKWW